MTVEEFLALCLKRQWHFTYRWVKKRYEELQRED